MRLIPIEQQPSEAISRACKDSEVLAQAVSATWDLYVRRGFITPWIGYLGQEDGEFIGVCGFAGPPTNGEVEIAYFTFPGNEGKGVATRMAAELLSITRSYSQGLTYIAHTLPQEGPSTSILRKLGFELAGTIEHSEDGPVWKWRET